MCSLQAISLFSLQFFLTLSWTVYAVFLPQLAGAAGLAAGVVVLLLMLDQVMFVLGDLVAGVAVDRFGSMPGWLGRGLVLISLLSCLALLLLPHLAEMGAMPLLLATVLWVITSSALRAPVFALLGRQAPKPAFPVLASGAMLGLGVASALGPLLTKFLRQLDPALPFALASIALAVAAVVTMRSLLAQDAGGSEEKPRRGGVLWGLALVIGVGALAFQVHANINSGVFYRRFASGEALDALFPLFWLGFSVAMPFAGVLARRWGELVLMVMAAGVACGSTWLAGSSGALWLLEGAQLMAGAAWALFLLPAITLAVALGRSGAEGRCSGVLFATLAVFALVRITLVWLQLPADAVWSRWLSLLPPLVWGLALCLLLAWRGRLRGVS